MRQRKHRRWGGLLTEEAKLAIGVAAVMVLYTVAVAMFAAYLVTA